MSIDINLIRHGSDAELRLGGSIDATNAPDVDKILQDVVSQYVNILFDMEKLTYVSSAGLRAFKRAYIEARRKGGTLSAKNVNRMVMEVFEVTGFTRMFRFI